MVTTNPPPPNVLGSSQANSDEPWRRELAHGTHNRRARFLWNPAFLVKALDNKSLPPVRSVGKPSNGAVVLADMFMFDNDSFIIEAQLLQSGPKHQTLQMHLIAPTVADANPRVILRWGVQEFTTTFRGGEATIDHLPPLHPRPRPANAPLPEFSLLLDFNDGADPSNKA